MAEHRPTTEDAPERAVVIACLPQGTDAAAELAEMRELLATARVETVGTLVQHRRAPDPSTYVGRGKLDELKLLLESEGAEVVVCDEELTPRQQRRLEDALEMRVVDRTAVILDIFAQHAHTAEGKLQVELAQLGYNLQRMRGMWKHLERLGGGVGTRGPGETQLESDRRMARRRVALLRERLTEVAGHRELIRKRRTRNAVPTVALAGYTNVGKSTLLNALTGARVSVRNRLFETLDPTTRAFAEGGRSYLITDTVGFIRRLPHGLVEAFAATLEETLAGDLVVLVADASAGEEGLAAQITAVLSVLREIGADDLPRLLVLNKIDRVDPLGRRRLANRFRDAVLASAVTGEGLETLKTRIADRFADRFEDVRLLVPHDRGAALAALYRSGAPIIDREDGAAGVLVSTRLPAELLARYECYRVHDDG
ncbi:MAG TPA: GTPase HflX [Gaiellales bacterium]|nr:GTPase HflX [Gaiellales bacterium]